jgi:hypothetical protein
MTRVADIGLKQILEFSGIPLTNPRKTGTPLKTPSKKTEIPKNPLTN